MILTLLLWHLGLTPGIVIYKSKPTKSTRSRQKNGM